MPSPAPNSRLAGAFARLEQVTGIYRPGRSPWVWLSPLANLVVTLGVVLWVGGIAGIGWAATVPLAIFCGLAMAALAVVVFASWDPEGEGEDPG